MWQTGEGGQNWESKKWYLIRSLFGDLPALSPIIETQEPSTLSDAADRPPSPLPDLIIEPIRKHNLHDEPTEFYTALQKEMRRMYKRDFLNVLDSESSSEELTIEKPNLKNMTFQIPAIIEPVYKNQNYKGTTFEIPTIEEPSFKAPSFEEQIYKVPTCDIPAIEETTLEESNFGELENGSGTHNEVSDDTRETLEDEDNETGNITNSFQSILDKFTAKTKDCDNTSPTYTKQTQTASSDSSMSEDVSNAIVTQAEVHASKKNDSYIVFKQNLEANICSWSRRSSAISGAIAGKDNISGYFSSSHNEGFVENRGTRFETDAASSSSSIPEPDVMRKRNTITSLDSVPRRFSSTSELNSKSIDKRVSMEAELSETLTRITSTDMDIIQQTDFSEPSFNISTPNATRSFIFKKAQRIKQRRVKRASPITSRRSNVKTKALQTSFSDDEAELRVLWNNFFNSEPIVYKPCSCLHHICT